MNVRNSYNFKIRLFYKALSARCSLMLIVKVSRSSSMIWSFRGAAHRWRRTRRAIVSLSSKKKSQDFLVIFNQLLVTTLLLEDLLIQHTNFIESCRLSNSNFTQSFLATEAGETGMQKHHSIKRYWFSYCESEIRRNKSIDFDRIKLRYAGRIWIWVLPAAEQLSLPKADVE